ncbi:MAG TPA: hypothetical protein VMT62_10690 [Syntrophorhabdaceae bacterium]|nr:hypothetical protein [Syntrophorhabdaceae bacterium]
MQRKCAGLFNLYKSPPYLFAAYASKDSIFSVYLKMAQTLKTWWPTNGLVIQILDESICYGADSWTIKLIIQSTIPVKSGYLADFEKAPHYSEIVNMLIPVTEYRREIAKSGVRADDLVNEKAALVAAFEESALGYLEMKEFPERYVRKLYKELEKELSVRKALEDKDSTGLR